MTVIEDLVTYEEAMIGSEKKEWKVTIKGERDSNEWNNTWIHTVLPSGKKGIMCEVV